MAALNEHQVKRFQESLADLVQSVIQCSPGPSGLQSQAPAVSVGTSSFRRGGSCSRALRTVRSMRGCQEEQRMNFAPYARNQSAIVKGQKSWKARFVCLSSCKDQHVPCSSGAKEVLLKAGLGERAVTIPDIECSGKEFLETLVTAFPKLQGSGGFELLRCMPNSKSLDVISTKIMQCPRMLKSIIGSGRVYIRPIQKDLSLEEEKEVDASPMIDEQCIQCGMVVKLSDLRKHVQICQLNASECIAISDSDEEDAFIASGASCISTMPQDTSLEAVLCMLNSKINTEINCYIEVCRGSILLNAMKAVKRSTFQVLGVLKVEFIGEDAVDAGGPRREFFNLLSKDMSTLIFEGPETMLSLKQDHSGIEAKKFNSVGVLMAMAIVQGGVGFPFFSNAMFEYICNVPLSQISVVVEEIPNPIARRFAKQVQDASTIDEITQGVDILEEVGYSTALLSIKHKQRICKAVHEYYCIKRIQYELDQLKEGLKTYGLLSELERHQSLFKVLFIAKSRDALTADKIKNLFIHKEFSPLGTIARELEQNVYMMFIEFLHDIEGGVIRDLSLKTVLSFFTGAEEIPTTGFGEAPSLAFSHSDSPFPTASTCATQLVLPTKNKDQTSFNDKMIYGLLNHGGFGKP